MDFNQHGIYSLNLKGNVLFVNFTGPFNDEFIQAFKVELEQCVNSLNNEYWGQIVTLDGLGLLTPEAEAMYIFTLKLLYERKLVATAIIISSPYMLVKEHIAQIYSSANTNHSFFRDESEALKWIKHELK